MSCAGASGRHAEGPRVGAALSEDAARQEVPLSQALRCWGLGSGVWRGCSFTLSTFWLLQPSSQFAPSWSDQPSRFAQDRGHSWDAGLSVLKQDRPRQGDELISVEGRRLTAESWEVLPCEAPAASAITLLGTTGYWGSPDPLLSILLV